MAAQDWQFKVSGNSKREEINLFRGPPLEKANWALEMFFQARLAGFSPV